MELGREKGRRGDGAERVVEAGVPGARRLRILLVDDNPADVRLTEEALRDSGLSHTLTIARDGVEAMQMLRGEGDHDRLPRPDVVLLDLNLPHKDGREVLAEIKADAKLRRIPVAVMTSSQVEEDVLRSYDLRANGYLIKPVDPEQVVGLLRGVGSRSS
jgi:chemotaxis family two-component system response regulator Rcp1